MKNLILIITLLTVPCLFSCEEEDVAPVTQTMYTAKVTVYKSDANKDLLMRVPWIKFNYTPVLWYWEENEESKVFTVELGSTGTGKQWNVQSLKVNEFGVAHKIVKQVDLYLTPGQTQVAKF